MSTLAMSKLRATARLSRFKIFAGFAIILSIWLLAPVQTVSAQDRFAVGAQIGGEGLSALGENPLSYGFRLTYGAFVPFISVDSEVNVFPTHSTGSFGQTQVFVGLKAGARVGRIGLFFKARPGLAHFYGGADPGRLTHLTNFAFDVGGGGEYYFAPHLALRLDLSDVMTSFGGGVLLAGPGGPIGQPLGTRGSFQSTLGLIVHF